LLSGEQRVEEGIAEDPVRIERIERIEGLVPGIPGGLPGAIGVGDMKITNLAGTTA
jgi:hypothetical protein